MVLVRKSVIVHTWKTCSFGARVETIVYSHMRLNINVFSVDRARVETFNPEFPIVASERDVCFSAFRCTRWADTTARAASAAWSATTLSPTTGRRWLRWSRRSALRLWPAALESSLWSGAGPMTTPVQTRWETDVFPVRAVHLHTPWKEPRLVPL